MKHTIKSRGWDSVFIYAAVILPLSFLGRHYQIGEPYLTIVMVAGILSAEAVYRLYRKNRSD
ncbi:hypothetical protein BG910_04995 [Neisseria chenwenguii]|uniref:Uncharacterized protein n=1 Tax=Neisseria chenwenguii TaxID=1853278 RepID=A0A220S193_9NEIS|nr:hypothetical protein BG910_04995 [Neisseria chenwenguii]ROV54885.1 hypothetical protein EGS38_10385 [Neisseria chenwenguii]